MLNNISVADELKIATGVAGTGYSFAGLTASEIAAILTAVFMLISIIEKLWKINKERKNGREAKNRGESSND